MHYRPILPVIPILILLVFGCKKDDSEPIDSRVIFEEYFDNNNLQWPEFEDEHGSAGVANGKYYFENKVADTNMIYSFYLYKDITRESYSIETNIECIEAGPDFKYGIEWQRKDGYNYHYMLISDHSYYVGYVYNYSYCTIQPWTESDNIGGLGCPNKIEIVKQLSHFSIRFNDVEIFNYEASIVVGNEVGFLLNSTGKIGIDYFKIY